MLNEAYERERLGLRVDHRSYKEREADRWVREATEHMGPTLTQADRKAVRQACREIRYVRVHNHLDRQEKYPITTRAKPRITTPPEHHGRAQPVMARHRRNRSPWLKRLGHNTPLERSRVAPPIASTMIRQVQVSA